MFNMYCKQAGGRLIETDSGNINTILNSPYHPMALNICTYVRSMLTSDLGVGVFISKHGPGLNSIVSVYHYHMFVSMVRFIFRNIISAILNSPHQGQIANVLYFQPTIISTSTGYYLTQTNFFYKVNISAGIAACRIDTSCKLNV